MFRSLVSRCLSMAAAGPFVLGLGLAAFGSVALAEDDDPGMMTIYGAGKAPSQEGAVLALHAEPALDPDGDAASFCAPGSIADAAGARIRLPGDGTWHVIRAYLATGPDSSLALAGATFGVRYTPNVKVRGQGLCNGEGIGVPGGEYPASGTGTGFTFRPIKTGRCIPVAWFVVSARGPGYFEVTPHPRPELAGRLASPTAPPRLSPITGYGRVGFELDGSIPEPGTTLPMGSCCLDDACFQTTEAECTFYKGQYLGTTVTCAPDNFCRADADRGACCLPSGCAQKTRRDCLAAGGTFLGELKPCTADACTKAGSKGGK